MGNPLYFDASCVLRAVLETGTTPEVESRIRDALVVVTSRLSLVESSRALARLRLLGTLTELQIADAARSIESVWSRCEIWELDRFVCDLARVVAPGSMLRALDALHLATYLLARQRIPVGPPRRCSAALPATKISC